MEGLYHVNSRCYTVSLWILAVILFMLLHYSESACTVQHCNPSFYCNGYICYGCNDGYYLKYASSCIQCQQSIPGCASCSSQTSCTKCIDGYYLQSGSCIQCQLSLPRCATCSSRTSCTRCIDGYYLQDASSCIQCELSIPDCSTCSSSTSCNKCNAGYYLQHGSCVQCPDRCSTCTNSTQCTSCMDTYWNLLSSCSSTCSIKCTNNVCDDTTGYCYFCKPGTYGPTCGQNCNLCKDGECDLRKCTNGCKDGYFQEDAASGYSYCYKFQNQLTFGHGLATGIGITIVLFGSGVGIALFIRRQTKQHKHADENSEEHHEYVNTNMTGILSVISSESNEVADAIHTVSSDLTNTGVTNIDSSRDYVMLGDRPTHESDYIDLQNT